jgi:hypothetical protein
MADIENKAEILIRGFWASLKDLLKERVIKDVESWDGAASNYDTTEAYCNACLINLNEGSPEDWTQANCKLPVRQQGDSRDTFVRQAVFAAAQRINQTEAPEEALKSAARQLKKAYGEMDEEAPEVVEEIISRALDMGTVWQKVWEIADQRYPLAFLHDIFTEEDGALFAVLSQEGQLYKSPISIVENQIELEEWFLVSQDFPAVETRTTIKRQKDGTYRWFSISASSTLNRVGEIDSRALFDSFEQHALETGEYPLRQFYHQGEQFRTGQADFIARDENLLITSGLFDDSILAQKEIEAREREPEYWGESIGFLPVEREIASINDVKIPVYIKGVCIDISTLPEVEAANLFTKTIQMKEDNMSLTGRAMEAFIKLFENEKEANSWLEENVDEQNRSIEEDKLVTRGASEEESPEEEVVEVEVNLDEELDKAITEKVEEAVTRVFEAQKPEEDKLDALISAVGELKEGQEAFVSRLEALEKPEEEKKRQLIDDLPRKATTKVMFRPSQAYRVNDELVEVAKANEVAAQNRPKVAY